MAGILEPLRVKTCYVSHFKGLISAKVELEAQGRGITFTLCHALLNKDTLHHKIEFVPFVFSTTVNYTYSTLGIHLRN